MDSLAGDVDSVAGGLSFLEPLLERVLADSVPQLHGWLRVFGKYSTLDRNGWRSKRTVSKQSALVGTSSRRHSARVTSRLNFFKVLEVSVVSTDDQQVDHLNHHSRFKAAAFSVAHSL